jgi:hypothetical protein
VACGAANAGHAETGHFEPGDVDALLPRVELTAL